MHFWNAFYAIGLEIYGKIDADPSLGDTPFNLENAVAPKNLGIKARKRRARYWRAWEVFKIRGHLIGDENF